ncbi:4'-phosphopantetheinyl transferase superfamily protein [Arcicella aurantiaca]|uniref:4'-phosphopantetheinyl transferase superfamily protein n=1 Tax=Arcicella aurantiaca TaxID=591202 RepID=A0A316ELN9_9BACT|nr:4'-phosphopantetheinyl transferase superfamily protein [Arcicella aurantiaca]PWK23890.1 4'-phosphopantetheinyl transferase superfamily protein [Arcicella aurantiaca]
MEFTTNIEMKRGDKTFLSAFAFIENCSKLRLKQVELALHDIEYQRYRSFSTDVRKVSFLLGRYCAKKAIASLYNIKSLNQIYIDSGIFNQPIIKLPNIPNMRVSISHDGVSAVALAFPEEHPMGIDIESIDDEKSSEMSTHFTAHEKTLYQGMNHAKNEIDTILWTAKESLSKALKTGLTTGLEIMELETLEKVHQRYFRGTFTHFFQYQTISIIHGNKVITLLLPRKSIVELDRNSNLFN